MILWERGEENKPFHFNTMHYFNIISTYFVDIMFCSAYRNSFFR